MNEVYLDDLRDKTHRGMTGAFTRGHHPGGKAYGYRSVRIPPDPSRLHDRSEGSRLEVDPAEANIVRRVFRDYAAGQSPRTIAHQLNNEGVAYPAKGTAREQARNGWSFITIRWMLRNERYLGRLAWNRTMFVKDENGKRRPVPRPESEWMTAERPELRIVPDELWNAAHARIRMIEEHYEPLGRNHVRRANALYSAHLLNGLLRCAHCNGRMEVISTRRSHDGGRRVYDQPWYLCSNARNKGPAVCKHTTRYRADLLEAAVIDQFRAAITPASIDRMTTALNEAVDRALRDESQSPKKLAAEIARLEKQAANLVRFLADGGSSEAVRGELTTIEQKIATAEAELAAASNPPARLHRKAHRQWLLAKIERLQDLLAKDPAQAKAEIARHLASNLSLRALPSPAAERDDWEITGAVNAEGLLGYQEALAVVGGRSRLLRGRDLETRTPHARSPWNPTNSQSNSHGWGNAPDRPPWGPLRAVSGRFRGYPWPFRTVSGVVSPWPDPSRRSTSARTTITYDCRGASKARVRTTCAAARSAPAYAGRRGSTSRTPR